MSGVSSVCVYEGCTLLAKMGSIKAWRGKSVHSKQKAGQGKARFVGSFQVNRQISKEVS